MRLRFVVMLIGGVVLPAGAARAGFEYIPSQPPIQTNQQTVPLLPPSVGLPPVSVPPAAGVPMPLVPPPPMQPVPMASGVDRAPLGPIDLTPQGTGMALPPSAPALVNPPPLGMPMPPRAAAVPPAALAPAPVALPAPVPAQALEGETLRGFAQDVALVVALRQIVPQRYTVSFDPAVQMGRQVSWRGGRSWRQVLADTLDGAGLRFVEQGAVIRIELGQGSRPATGMTAALAPVARPAPLQPMLDETGELPDLPPPSGMPAPLQMPRALAAVARPSLGAAGSWRAEQGATLREVLEEWAKRSDWTIAWQTDREYRLEASAEFQGDFQQAAADLVGAFDDAQPPVTATFYRNRTLVIATDIEDRGRSPRL